MYYYYRWRLLFPKSGEVLEGSRLYTSDNRATRYLRPFLWRHHAAIRYPESACTELTVWKEDGSLLYGINGDVFGNEQQEVRDNA